MEVNAGVDAVRASLGRLLPGEAIDQRVTWECGDSHEILPRLRAQGQRFDLITVDGDHTPTGQAQDLRDALAVLAPGGTLIVDDAYDRGNPDGPILTTCLEVLASYPHTVDIRIAAGSIPWLVVTAPEGR
jgi:predicted O-methyltransferase YrrM